MYQGSTERLELSVSLEDGKTKHIITKDGQVIMEYERDAMEGDTEEEYEWVFV